MRRFDCGLRVVFVAAIPHVSHDRRVEIENTLSPHRDVDLLRNLKCLLRGCRRAVLSLCTKLFRSFVIATVVRGRGGSVSMCCVDMQVRGVVIFALGHCVHHLPGGLRLLHL